MRCKFLCICFRKLKVQDDTHSFSVGFSLKNRRWIQWNLKNPITRSKLQESKAVQERKVLKDIKISITIKGAKTYYDQPYIFITDSQHKQGMDLPEH